MASKTHFAVSNMKRERVNTHSRNYGQIIQLKKKSSRDILVTYLCPCSVVCLQWSKAKFLVSCTECAVEAVLEQAQVGCAHLLGL